MLADIMSGVPITRVPYDQDADRRWLRNFVDLWYDVALTAETSTMSGSPWAPIETPLLGRFIKRIIQVSGAPGRARLNADPQSTKEETLRKGRAFHLLFLRPPCRSHGP
jgi:hypothetical protein